MAVQLIAGGLCDVIRCPLDRLFFAQQGGPFDQCFFVIDGKDLGDVCPALVFADECEEVRCHMAGIYGSDRYRHRIYS